MKNNISFMLSLMAIIMSVVSIIAQLIIFIKVRREHRNSFYHQIKRDIDRDFYKSLRRTSRRRVKRMKREFQELCSAALLSVVDDTERIKNTFKNLKEKIKRYVKIQPNCMYRYKGRIDELESVEYPFDMSRFDKQGNIEIIDDVTSISLAYDGKIDKHRNKVYVYEKINNKLMCYIIKKTDLEIIITE